jgi:hypothetical protein
LEILEASNINYYPNIYIIDYNSDEVMYSVICEDLLYVQLNLLLAIDMSIYFKTYFSMDLDYSSAIKMGRDPNFFSEVPDILNKHISKHKKGYDTLQKIRETFINKWSDEHIYAYYIHNQEDLLEAKNEAITDIQNCINNNPYGR